MTKSFGAISSGRRRGSRILFFPGPLKSLVNLVIVSLADEPNLDVVTFDKKDNAIFARTKSANRIGA
jgi:hypothetical protein